MTLKTVVYRLRQGLALGLIASLLLPVLALAADQSAPRLPPRGSVSAFPAGAPPFLQSFGLKTPSQINAFLRVAARAKLEPRADLTAKQVRDALAAYADDLVGRAGVSQTAEVGELAALRAELRDSRVISMIAPEKRVVLMYSRNAVAEVIKEKEAFLGRKIQEVGENWDDKKSDAVSAAEASPRELPSAWRLAKAAPGAAQAATDREISIQSVKRLLRIDPDSESVVLSALHPQVFQKAPKASAAALEAQLRKSGRGVSPETITELGALQAAMIREGKEVSIAALEARSGEKWPPEVRAAAAAALGLVYAARIERGHDDSIDPLEELLKSYDEEIRLKAAGALGAIYAARIRQGKEISVGPLEASLRGPWEARAPAAAVLGGVYAAMVRRGKEVSTEPLEALLDDDDEDARDAAIASLGAVYAAKIEQGRKISVRPLEALLNSSRYVRHFAAAALAEVYAAMSRQSEFFIRPAEQKKYEAWREHNLPFEEAIVDRYLAAADGAAFIGELEAQAVKIIEEGFDPADDQQRWLAFLGARMRGLEMGRKEFEERLAELVRFDGQHPGYLKGLFSKARGLPSLSVSGQAQAYRLEPQGLLAAFRGESFKTLHEDTISYGVYKGKKLAGYVAMMVGKAEDGRRVLTIDAINSPSLDGKSFLGNLFRELSAVAKLLDCAAIALPRNIGPPFNFKNSHAVKTMPIYKTAQAVKVKPVHAESWAYFSDETPSSIDDGRFKLLDVR